MAIASAAAIVAVVVVVVVAAAKQRVEDDVLRKSVMRSYRDSRLFRERSCYSFDSKEERDILLSTALPTRVMNVEF